MEHAIGSIITLPDGRKAEVVRVRGIKLPYKMEKWLEKHHLFTSPCKKCALELNINCLEYNCTPAVRTDGKNIIYKEIKEEK